MGGEREGREGGRDEGEWLRRNWVSHRERGTGDGMLSSFAYQAVAGASSTHGCQTVVT